MYGKELGYTDLIRVTDGGYIARQLTDEKTVCYGKDIGAGRIPLEASDTKRLKDVGIDVHESGMQPITDFGEPAVFLRNAQKNQPQPPAQQQQQPAVQQFPQQQNGYINPLQPQQQQMLQMDSYSSIVVLEHQLEHQQDLLALLAKFH